MEKKKKRYKKVQFGVPCPFCEKQAAWVTYRGNDDFLCDKCLCRICEGAGKVKYPQDK